MEDVIDVVEDDYSLVHPGMRKGIVPISRSLNFFCTILPIGVWNSYGKIYEEGS